MRFTQAFAVPVVPVVPELLVVPEEVPDEPAGLLSVVPVEPEDAPEPVAVPVPVVEFEPDVFVLEVVGDATVTVSAPLVNRFVLGSVYT